MTGLEIFLLIAGMLIMVVSFLFGEQLDSKNDTGVSIDEDEIKRTVKSHVDDAVEEVVEDTIEKTAIELDRLSNEKIMAVSDYSENVLGEIARNHEEVMFLYGMLNDKEEQIKDTVKDVEMLKASVKNMAKKITAQHSEKRPEEKTDLKKPPKDVKTAKAKQQPKKEKEMLPESEEAEPEDGTVVLEEQMNNNQKILSLYRNGMSNIDIAKELNLGLGEVRLVIDLYRTRGN